MILFLMVQLGRRVLMCACLIAMVWLPQYMREFVLSLVVLLLAEATHQAFAHVPGRNAPKEPISDTIYSSEGKQ